MTVLRMLKRMLQWPGTHFPNLLRVPSPVLSQLTFGTSKWGADFADVKKAVSDGGAIIIDVRNPDELKSAGKIPNSVNLPLPDIPDALRLSESAFRNRFGFTRPGDHQAVIVHCKSGVRAAKAAGLLTAAGFYNMRIYKGSFSDWVSQGGEVKK